MVWFMFKPWLMVRFMVIDADDRQPWLSTSVLVLVFVCFCDRSPPAERFSFAAFLRGIPIQYATGLISPELTSLQKWECEKHLDFTMGLP